MNNTLSYPEICERAGGPVVAVVFGVGHFQGLAVLRGLGAKGIPVYALGQEKSVGFASRYATQSMFCPDPHDDPNGIMKLMLDLGRSLKSQGKRAVLFPTRDSVVNMISQNQDVLSEYFICHVPKPDVIARCSDKEAQYRMAEQSGVGYPRTYMDDDLARLYKDLEAGRQQFPIILKPKRELPLHLKRKFRVVFIRTREELENVISNVRKENIPFLIQDVIPGGDDALYTFGSCMGKDGELKAVFTGRKLRQQPPRFGICRVGESKKVDEIVPEGGKLLKSLGFFGISQVEFKFDHRDGKYKLMEVNPRPWAWISLPIEMGINLPFAHFCDALGIPTPFQSMSDRRGVWISVSDDFYWSVAGRDGKPWVHLFKGYDKVVEAYYVGHDPKPGLLHFGRSAVELTQLAVGKVVKIIRR